MSYRFEMLIRRFARCCSAPLRAVLLAALLVPAVAMSQSPAPLNLGCTESFAVLAGSTVTSTGFTVVDGNIGLSPGSATVGFPPAIVVNGAIHINDALAIAGQGCLLIAYNDAAGRTPVPTGTFLNPGSGNIGGLTLVAGLYKFTSTASITGSNVTLNGGPNDVWIFQIATNLVVGNAVQVLLAGGAQASNIFWQVGTSATIGTGSFMKGTILADQSISFNTGSVLDGRAFARIGAVTLAGNLLTKPIPDSLRPTVISTMPTDMAMNVPANQTLTATFSHTMDSSTITDSTFSVKKGATPVVGTVTYSGSTASFTPTNQLDTASVYTATITTGARSSTGTALANDYTWSFSTTGVQDTTPPTVTSTIPLYSEMNVPVDQNISAVFNEMMDSSTLTDSTFRVMKGATPVAGTVTYSGLIATFNPTNQLDSAGVYTATITTGARNTSGIALANDYTWVFTTEGVQDTATPTVISTIPTNAALGVSFNQNIIAVFSEPMDSSTITSTTFNIRNGPTNIAGVVTYSGVTATFNPSSQLDSSTVYTATVTTGARDRTGTALANNYTWTFTTAGVRDTTAPIVISTIPSNAALGVPVNQNIVAVFNETMNASTITGATFSVRKGATLVAGVVTYSGVTATFNPTNPLDSAAVYTATITTGARNTAGLALASNYTWSFTTGAGQDTSAPSVTSTIPLYSAMGVSVNQNISAVFNEMMDSSTITSATFTVRNGATLVVGTVTYSGLIATFNPTNQLDSATVYTATITTGARNRSGIGLANNYTWVFTTEGVQDTARPSVISTIPSNAALGVPTVNQNIVAVFSGAMDPSTITGTTFSVRKGATLVVGTVTYSGVTATFRPTNQLDYATVYTATITTGARNTAGTSLANDYTWSFTTSGSMDTTPLTVISTIPSNVATGVPINQRIVAVFSEVVDPLTITTATFTLKAGQTAIAGSVTSVGATATFTPNSPLTLSTIHTATISTGVKDLAGNPMANAYVWYFITGADTDTSAPFVRWTIPADTATNVAVNQRIAAIFSEKMDASSISNATFSVKRGTTNVPGTVTYVGLTATFTPAVNMLSNTTYTATIASSVLDLGGNPMAVNYVWTFTTGVIPDLTSPTVISTDPTNAETGVVPNVSITAVFSKEMDPLTITNSSFTLHLGTQQISGTIMYVGTVATFEPMQHLLANRNYRATITTAATDLAGNALAMDYTWNFTTGPALPAPLPVNLDCANNFVVLAGSTVTSTGNTIVRGDVGVSPGSAVIGFPPGQVLNGSIHINNAPANNAKLCLTVAFNDVAGRSLNAIIVSDGELGGKTLTPGLYRSAPGQFGITNSDLTLDAQGDANAVWIFQMPYSTLTVGSGRKVILAGGAQSGNIFWQVGTSASIGTTAAMKGTIMADQSITLNTGASLNGRALARTAAVNLNGNVINRPDIIVSVDNKKAPTGYTLSQNYPNPFNPGTSIEYGIAKPGRVSLRIYNVYGTEVATLVDTYQEAGIYVVSFNSNETHTSLPSGIYYYRLTAGEFVSMNRKFILLK